MLKWRLQRPLVFAGAVLLAACLNVAFVVGDWADPSLHDVRLLFAALLVNLLATGLKLGDRTHVGAVHLSASLVADLQLVAAAVVWLAGPARGSGALGDVSGEVLSLSGGALLANVVSVTLLLIVTMQDGLRRR